MARSSISEVHNFSFTVAVEYQQLFTYKHTLAVCSLSLSRRRSDEKPSMCNAPLLLLLLSPDSVNTRMEAVLFLCRWLTQACNSSSLLLRDRTFAVMIDGARSAHRLCVSCFSLALTPLFFKILLFLRILLPGGRSSEYFFWKAVHGSGAERPKFGLLLPLSRKSLV